MRLEQKGRGRGLLSPHFPRVLNAKTPSHGPIFRSARTGTLATQTKTNICFHTTRHWGFVFEVNSVKEITWLSWHHWNSVSKVPFSNTFPSTRMRHQAGIFKFRRYEERFLNFQKSPSLSLIYSVPLATSSFTRPFRLAILYWDSWARLAPSPGVVEKLYILMIDQSRRQA